MWFKPLSSEKQPGRYRFFGSRAKITLFAIIVCIVGTITLVSGFVGYFLTHDNILNSVKSNASIICSVASKLATRRIATLEIELRSLSVELMRDPKYPATISAKNYELSTLLERKSREFGYLSLAIYSPRELVVSYGRPVPDTHALLSGEYARRAWNGETVTTTTEITNAFGVVMYIYTLLGPDHLLVAAYPGMAMSDLLSEFKSLANINIFMLDKTGAMIANHRPQLVLERRNFLQDNADDPHYSNIGDVFSKMVQGRSGVGFYDYEDEGRVTAYAPIVSSDGWSVGVAIPLQETVLIQTRNALLFSGALILGMGMLAAFFAANFVSRPFDIISKQNASLTELTRLAEAASNAKSHFIANTSHEMRTPLNAIIGLSNLTLNSEEMAQKIPPDVTENIENIYTSGMTLLAIVNDLLDISKIESGRFELSPVTYDLPSLINDTVSLNIVRINERPIKFKLEIDPNLPNRITGDDIRVKQIFNNLLSNAFKYTEEGRVIWRLSFERDGDFVWLVSSVQDSGIGIRKEDIQRLFSDYNQVDVQSNRKIEGTGLGLSITKKIVELMGGSISCQSIYGHGTVFHVRFKQQSAVSVPLGAELAKTLERFDYTTSKRVSNARLARAHIPYAKILIVDDVQANLDVARGVMKPYGMQIDCVTSGIEAVRLVREGKIRYNAIFMDHMMPEMDGIEAARIIREEIDSEYAKTVPIVALTANAVVGNEAMFLEHGFQAFCSKPIDIYRMDQIINTWVRDKELEQSTEADAPEPDRAPMPTAPEKRAASAEAPKCPGRIEGIDWDKGLERFAGDEEVYLSVLRSYLVNTTQTLEKVRCPTPETLPDYAITVHGIKGSSFGVEAQEVAKLAYALEMASKAGDFAFVGANNPPFIQAVEALLARLADALPGEDQDAKETRDAPDEALLEQLREAAAGFNFDGMEEAVGELGRFDYRRDGELVAWLKNKVETMAFGEIRDRLEKREPKT